MKKLLLLVVAMLFTLVGCAGYQYACEDWFGGKWSNADRGSCTRGPMDLLGDALD